MSNNGINSEGIPFPQFSDPPIVPLQHQPYAQFLPMQIPLRSLPNTMNSIEDLISLQRADVANQVIEGQVDRMVAHTLIETPMVLGHTDNPTLHEPRAKKGIRGK